MSGIYPYAGFWKRAIAFLLDSIILSIPSSFLGGWMVFSQIKNLVSLSTNSEPNPDMLASFFSLYAATFALQGFVLLFSWLYHAIMESSKTQATLGKMVMGIKVVNENGKRISFARATGRFFAKWISAMTLYVGFFMAGATRRKQALHDIIATTYIVDKNFQEGQEFPDVQTHFVLLVLSVLLMLALFFLPVILLPLLLLKDLPNTADMEVPSSNTETQWDEKSFDEDTKLLMNNLKKMELSLKLQDKMRELDKLPADKKIDFEEDDVKFSFTPQGLTATPKWSDNSFYLKTDDYLPCCKGDKKSCEDMLIPVCTE